MGNCIFCGNPAGFMRSKHEECQSRHDKVAAKIPAFFAQSMSSTLPAKQFAQMAFDISRAAYISDEEINEIAIKGIEAAADRALVDHVLTREEEQRFAEIAFAFGIPAETMNARGIMHKIGKAAIVRDLDAGMFPTTPLHITGHPFMFEKDERPIWLFNDANYTTLDIRSEFVSGSAGISVRIMKGVWVRTGRMKGHRVKSQVKTERTGILLVSNKNIRFADSGPALRLRLREIGEMRVFDDGLLLRTNRSEKPHIFNVDDLDFLVNIIGRISQID